jgi:hypothetical protein
MKLNIDAIKKKIANLNGERKAAGGDMQFWKPNVGTYRVRAMHWPDGWTEDGVPFIERWVYYNISNRAILAPKQFGKEDPIDEFRGKLFQSKDPADKEIAKKLFARLQCHAPIIVRSAEGEGATVADPEKVLIWRFNNTVYQKLLSYFMEEEIDDWMDPTTGFDLIVKIRKQGGKTFLDWDIELARKSSKLAETDEKVLALQKSIPDVRNFYKEQSAAEIRQALNAYLAGTPDNSTAGDEHVAASEDKSKTDLLDELVAEVTPPPVVEEKKAKTAKVAKKDDVVTTDQKSAAALDDAFAELMDE